ncbi:MAG: site-specific DNA-methyltransferase [Phycisphaerales bacterium]|nr:site-specific DNA-methyltransferase [Phycisphaerales bacterium]
MGQTKRRTPHIARGKGNMPTLQFKGKSVIETYHHTVAHHRLEFDAKLSCLPRGEKPSLEGNLIIEGDNLLALKALLPTHAGRVKCIYIDPPYNTGNEGWIYNDNLTAPQFKEWIGQTVGKEGEDATRHDKWCCMMYPRLQLLWELLADDGVIMVSIDDNEMHHLRAIMDNVFGNGSPGDAESNFVGAIAWRTRNTDNRVKTNLSVDHEYALVYRKTTHGAWNGRVIDRSDFQNPDDDSRGPYVTDPLTGKATAAQRPNLHFVIVNPRTRDRYEPDPSRGWITDKAGIDELIADNRIWWPPDPNTGKPRKKRFLSETDERMPESSFWADIRGQSGADEVDQILGKRVFEFPKLTEFVARLLDVASPRDALILDCTAGSGTTGHAVLKLNDRDGGNRKFVLVQQRHDNKRHEADGLNICEKVTAERVRKVIAGYSYTKPKRGGGTERTKVDPLGGSFTYARVGEPLFTEYKNFGENLPDWDTLARYIFYTETSRDIDMKKMKPESGLIGRTEAAGGTAYYLLYTPNKTEDRPLGLDELKAILTKEKGKARALVIYCEKIWMHPDERQRLEEEHGVRVRPMLVPFNLR